ncbi:hypothetical protein L3Y34_000567 [Caenorhabditis briggsae]|uniref:Pre-mRNA-splicing factor SPF27 n=1 Tax=Caenorhabditis briggsae TaxID=6238 RepID=A0AAE9IMP0_CAEBR|nr:hypothetical protein L3Y34_000567 [Caenorhabditis briggsae]
MSDKPLALTGPGGASQLQDEQVLVDALPYLDTEYNETDRQLARNLVEHECKTFRPTKNYLTHLPVPDYDAFLTPCMLKEMSRMKKKEEMGKLDMSRCELPPPSAVKGVDRKLWAKVLRNAKAQNEHLMLRQINLELMDEYAAENYLQRNKAMEQILTEAEKELRSTRDAIMEIHASRKMAQLKAGDKVKQLEQSWVSMVTNNYKMELENRQMESDNAKQIKRLKLDPANPDTIAALQEVKDLNVEGFYTALRDLYLADGFSTKSTMNKVILTQSIIPDFQFQGAIQALNNTQYEIKNGDYGLRRMKGMIKLNEPDALTHQNWLIDLVSMILEQSEYSKQLVSFIRGLGTTLMENGYSRETYFNGTMLRAEINKIWNLNETLKERYIEPLVLLHHVVGPENFDLLGDVLEAQPWLTRGGMLLRDVEYFRMYQDRIMEAISNSDIGITVLSGFQKAYEDMFNTTGAPDTLLNRLVIFSMKDSTIYDGGDDKSPEYTAVWNEIWGEISRKLGRAQLSQIQYMFVDAVKKAMDETEASTIGGMNGLKNTFIAGARLIQSWRVRCKCQF